MPRQTLRWPRPNILPVRKGHEASKIESSPKVAQTKFLSAGKGHVAPQNKSGPPTMMELLRTMNDKIEETNRLLVRTGNKLDGIVKDIWNNN